MQTVASIKTFDGLTVTIVSAEIDEKNYSRFSFAAEENSEVGLDKNGEDAKEEDKTNLDPLAEAKSLNTIMSGWAYAIPDFKYELFVRKQEQLSRKTGSADDASGEDDTEAR